MRNNRYILNLLGVTMLFLGAISCKENAVICETPEEVSYTQTIAPLIEAKCFKCHAEASYKYKASRVKIYNYESLKKRAEDGSLLGAITHQKGFVPMPFRKGEKIDTCSIAAIATWINTGMKK